jgi:hypothetical protein
MTLVYERKITGSAVHALVIGVGAYPWAKPFESDPTKPEGPAKPKALENLRDLNGAPVGAKMFADWLISHADGLADGLPAPLATVELALSAPSSNTMHYEWKSWAIGAPGDDPRPSTAVSDTDYESVEAAGERWAERLQKNRDQIAVFYICGHGMAIPGRIVALLSDVAGPCHRSAWKPLIDVEEMAGVMSHLPTLKEGYLFVDACQEVVPDMVYGEVDKSFKVGEGVQFFVREGRPGKRGISPRKVLLLVPGPIGTLTWGDDNGGRFTRVLVEALNGAAACNYTGLGNWGVKIDKLPGAMLDLYDIHWPVDPNADPFDPTPVKSFVPEKPFVRFRTPPRVPFALTLHPSEAIHEPSMVLSLHDADDRALARRTGRAEKWIDWVQAQMELCHFHAEFSAIDAPYKTPNPKKVSLCEMRMDLVLHVESIIGPRFERWVAR